MTTRNSIIADLKKAVKFLEIWLLVFIALTAGVGIVLYQGIVGIPNSATYLLNINNLDQSKLWDDFKIDNPQLDTSILNSQFYFPTPNVLSVDAKASTWQEELAQPKTVVSFHVSIDTSFGSPPYSYTNNYFLKLPSLLVLLLDQNERVRGKIYTQQVSSDFFMSGKNQSDYTFWFKVPDDMQNQKITIIVELFGIVDSSDSINQYQLNQEPYYNSYSSNYGVYGFIPSWDYKDPNTAYFHLLSYSRIDAHTPATYSIVSIAAYSLTLAGLISTLLVIPIWLREKTKEWWKKNKVYAIFGILFLITYIILLFLIGVLL